MKKARAVLWVILIFSCTDGKQKTNASVASTPVPVVDTLEKTASSQAYQKRPPVDTNPVGVKKPQPRPVKEPLGIYQVVLPYNDSVKLEQIVQFNSDHTYRLQERFLPQKNDSVVLAAGSWTPSDGVIWLYKEQLVRGRYKWKGNTLQYFNPPNKTYPMEQLTSIMNNDAWKNKKAEGVILFGTGTEPFWSVAFNNKDTVEFLLSDWEQPVKMKVGDIKADGDSTVYTAEADSVQLKLVVFPYFCNDGMSDNVYQNKVLVHYNQKTYSGCGVLYR